MVVGGTREPRPHGSRAGSADIHVGTRAVNQPQGLGLRLLGRNITLTLARQLLTIALNLALAIFLARSLGADGNGLYALAILLSTFLAAFLSLGIEAANVYYVGRGEVSVSTALRATLALWAGLSALGLAMTGVIVSVWGSAWFPGVPRSYLLLATGIFPLTLLRQVITSLFQARQDFHTYNRLLLAPAIATLALSVLFLAAFGWGVPGALLATALGSAAGITIAARGLRPHLRVEGQRAQGESARSYIWKCLGYGWRAHLSNVLAFVNYRADMLLLNIFLAPAAAGIYVVAVQVAERLWVPSQVVSAVLLPRLSELHDRDEQRRTLTPLITRWILLAAIVSALFFATVTPLFVRIVFGQQYAAAGVALLWLLPGVALGAAARVLANDIAARGRPELNMYAALCVVSINIVGNVLLIPRYGINGAAMATSIAYTVNAVITQAMYARLSGNRWQASVLVTRADCVLLSRALRLRRS